LLPFFLKDFVVANWQTHGVLENFPMVLGTKDKRLFVGCRLPARMLGRARSSVPARLSRIHG
jgi:hypothetical protein